MAKTPANLNKNADRKKAPDKTATKPPRKPLLPLFQKKKFDPRFNGKEIDSETVFCLPAC